MPATVVECEPGGVVGVIVAGTLTVGVVGAGVVALGGALVVGAELVGATVPGWAPFAGVVAAWVLVAGGGVTGVIVVPWTRTDEGIVSPSGDFGWLVVPAAGAPAGKIAATQHATVTLSVHVRPAAPFRLALARAPVDRL